jgi:hypothetical protein
MLKVGHTKLALIDQLAIAGKSDSATRPIGAL